MKAIIKILALVMALTILCGCGAPAAQPAPSDAQPEESASAEPEVTDQTLPEDTEPSTQSSTEPPTEPSTEPPVVLHSGLREDGSFDEHTLFLGDSLTFMLVGYMEKRGYAGDLKVAAKCGAFLSGFFNEEIKMDDTANGVCLYSPEFRDLGFDDAAELVGEEAHAIYMMFGTNFSKKDTAQDYIDIVDFLLRVCPNATVHMQLIPYGELPYDVVNERVTAAFNHFQESGQQRVMLIDTFTAIGREPADGIHQSNYGNGNWYQCLLDHARDNQLSQ